MGKLGQTLLVGAMIGFTSPLHAQRLIVSDSAARDVLAEAHTLRCAFDSAGVGFEYATSTRPNATPPFRPQVRRGGYDNPEFIDQIDRERRSARLILPTGAVNVDLLSGSPLPHELRHVPPNFSGNSVSFLWQAMNNPIVITVFANRWPGSMTELVAVMTRHMEWFGGLSVSQHYGRCAVLFS